MLLIMYRYVGYSKLALLTISVEMLSLAIIQCIIEGKRSLLGRYRDSNVIEWNKVFLFLMHLYCTKNFKYIDWKIYQKRKNGLIMLISEMYFNLIQIMQSCFNVKIQKKNTEIKYFLWIDDEDDGSNHQQNTSYSRYASVVPVYKWIHQVFIVCSALHIFISLCNLLQILNCT